VKRLRLWRRARLASQIACLCAFLWLFLQTEYRGEDVLPWPVSLLFRIDPLAALADAMAPGPFGWRLLWPALLLVVLTALFGRFFCGWVCPLGTTLDGCGKVVIPKKGRGRASWRSVKYYLLLVLTASALFGVQLMGLFDPLSIFLRSLTISLYPAGNLAANGLFQYFYDHRVPVVSSALDRAYPVFRDHLMAFNQPVFALSTLTFVLFMAILLLERIERRFWCRNLCPLGALLGICASKAPFHRSPENLCTPCRLCADSCRMDAAGDGEHRRSECILCLDCGAACPQEKISFSWKGISGSAASVDLGRRGVITALAAGFVAAPVARIAPEPGRLNPYLLRPPGAAEEAEFLRRCIRCGECMKVCIGQALHPAFLQAGAAGLYTPLVVPRVGYCEYNCTLCGQVCPTGAIELLPLDRKKKTVIGIAVFDKNRCLPFARNEECLVCEEHCPTGSKAIVFDEKNVVVDGTLRSLKVPRVVRERCIGCGICETKCPLDGASAIRVVNEAESRKRE